MREFLQRKNKQQVLSRSSIKQGLDELPVGIVFARKDGTVLLANHVMHALSHAVFGEPLDNAEWFWKNLDSVLRNPAIHVLENEDSGGDHITLSFPENRFMRFERSLFSMDGLECIEIFACDVTDIVSMNDHLRRDRVRLIALSAELGTYSAKIRELAREEALLERKIFAHSHLGRLLLQTQLAVETKTVSEELLSAWQCSADILKKDGATIEEDFHELLHKMAHAVGVKVIISPDTPRYGKRGELLFIAGCEALTNMIRHASASTMTIRSIRDGDKCHITITNDGLPPKGSVREGGGLSGVRRRIEAAGGTMVIISKPAFAIEIVIPEMAVRRKV